MGSEMETPPALEPMLARDFVANAHGDLERVKALLAEQPKLVNAAWDWGGGDWETGLGAASHVGRRDIAEYLLEQGARLDLFAATMLGKLEIVRATLEAFPGCAACSGSTWYSADRAREGGWRGCGGRAGVSGGVDLTP